MRPYGSEAVAPARSATTATGPRLRVELFGGVLATVRDRRIDIPSAKARALLVALVLGGTGEESREVLSERLWSRGENAEKQRNSLKRDLKTLVDLLVAQGFDGLYGRRQTVHLDLTRVDCDVIEALRSAERGWAHAALLGGDRPFDTLARGADDVDPEFSAWLRARTAELAAATSRALDLALARPDLDIHRRLDLARAAFNLDRTKEPAAIALMEIHEAMGDVSAALRVYSALYFAHMREHGDPPGGRILEVAERLKPEAAARAAADPQPEDEAPAREGAPASVALVLGEGAVTPALRAAALRIPDLLGRRPGLLHLSEGGDATHELRLLAAPDGAVFGQVWQRAGSLLVWSDRMEPADEAGFRHAVLRIVAAVTGSAALLPATGQAPEGLRSSPLAETFALRLLTSDPAHPAPVPEGPPDPDTLDAAAQTDRGWLDLLAGRTADAERALRRALALDPEAPELAGAVALGLALLGLADEAVELADRLAPHGDDPALRALRGMTLAICGERRSAALLLTKLPEDWILPRSLGAVMAELSGNRALALSCLGASLARMAGTRGHFCDWALRSLPVPDRTEPQLLRATLVRLLELAG